MKKILSASKRALCALLVLLMLTAGLTVAHAAEPEDTLIKGTFTMKTFDGFDPGEQTYFYSDSYFRTSGKESDAHLKTMSAALVFPIQETSETPVETYGAMLKNIGFRDIAAYDLDHTALDTLGMLLAHKTVDGKEVVAVVPRGDKYEHEMAANMLSGTEGDIQAFAQAETLMENRVSAYLSEHGITSAKYWVVGYSRSGAVAELFGRELNRAPEKFFTCADDIYVYTFESPNGSEDDTVYENIHRTVDRRDAVTYVYLNGWGIYSNGTPEYIGAEDDTVMLKTLDLFAEGYMSDLTEMNTADYLTELSAFLAANLSRETFYEKLGTPLCSVLNIYFDLNAEQRSQVLPFFQQAFSDMMKDSMAIPILLTAIALPNDPSSAENVAALIVKHLDQTAADLGKPVDDESFETVKAAIQPVIEALMPVIAADLTSTVDMGDGKAPKTAMLYHLMTFAGNLMPILKNHFNYNVFNELKARDSYYQGDERAVRALEKKEIAAHLYGMDDTTAVDCLFRDELPEVPLVDAAGYLSCVYKGDFTETESGGVYTITGNGGVMTVDVNSDTVTIDNFENMSDTNVVIEDAHAPYAADEQLTFVGERNKAAFDLSAYQIDLVGWDGRAYFPLTTLCDIFSLSDVSAEYLDGALWFDASHSVLNNSCYYDRSSVYASATRSAAMAAYSYNELCFVMDRLYGMPSKAAIAQTVKEVGFDKAIEVFCEDTRLAKPLLQSEDKVDYYIGMCLLNNSFSDGGHTNLFIAAADFPNYPESAFLRAYLARFNSDDPLAVRAKVCRMDNGIEQGTRGNGLVEDREAAFAQYTTVEAWGDEDDASSLVTHGDTAVFSFNQFNDDAVTHFKWSLDYAKAHGFTKFVIDLGSNGGGQSETLQYFLAMITNRNRDTNVNALRSLCTVTGNLTENRTTLDLNLDGVFDDKDKEVYYDFRFAVITSEIAFSCGNMLPCMLQDAGIPVIGETSSGGACCSSSLFSAGGCNYAISGSLKYMRADNGDVDRGAAVDLQLTAENEEELRTDYSGLYDLDRVSEIIDAYYDRVMGDVNLDGKVTIDDATLIQKSAIDLVSFSDLQKQLADVNRDGRVSVLDVTCVQKYLADYPSGTGDTGKAA